MSGSSHIYNKDYKNPFSQSQARTFSSQRIADEFKPTSIFWSLFNEQHEILVGTRGCGKTILMRMMRYSLISKLKSDEATAIINEKKYIAIYAPTQIEFMGLFKCGHQDVQTKQMNFTFAFNCLIAQSFLHELTSILKDISIDEFEYAEKSRSLTRIIKSIWFPHQENRITYIEDLAYHVTVLFQTTRLNEATFNSNVPLVFQNLIGKPITSISSNIANILQISEDTKWLICIDEAEFLDDIFQECLNTVMRSHSGSIVLKIATLPYRYTSYSTLMPNVFCGSNGNDFNFRPIDLELDSDDFKNVINAICKARLSSALPPAEDLDTLSAFIGDEGMDQKSIFEKEFPELNTRDLVETEILKCLDHDRADLIKDKIGTDETLKPIYNRYAPLYYLREMYKRSKVGASQPGWFAGEKVIRQLSQGNPRRFIQIMHTLFEEARTTNDLSLKKQHRVLKVLSETITKSSKGLEVYGPVLYDQLESIGDFLKERTHDVVLKETGNSFSLTEKTFSNPEAISAIKLGIAYSYLTVDEDALLNGLTVDTRYSLANIVCAYKWLPFRVSGSPKWTGSAAKVINVNQTRLEI